MRGPPGAPGRPTQECYNIVSNSTKKKTIETMCVTPSMFIY